MNEEIHTPQHLQPDHISNGPQQPVPPTVRQPMPNEKRGQFRKYFLYVLIGGVVISAIISIVAILIGEINDYISRALLTTLSMVIHAMVALAFMSATSKDRSIGQEIVTNTLFTITIASFFTSTLSIWKVISGDMTMDFYQLYLYALVAAFIVQVLLSVNVIDKVTNRLMQTSVGLTAFMWLYLIPSVFDDGYPKGWPEIYYRGIAAIGILLGTVLVLVTIFHRLYLTKHPEVVAARGPRAGGIPVWLIVVLCVVGLPVLLGYLGTIIGVLGFFVSR